MALRDGFVWGHSVAVAAPCKVVLKVYLCSLLAPHSQRHNRHTIGGQTNGLSSDDLVSICLSSPTCGNLPAPAIPEDSGPYNAGPRLFW